MGITICRYGCRLYEPESVPINEIPSIERIIFIYHLLFLERWQYIVTVDCQLHSLYNIEGYKSGVEGINDQDISETTSLV
jgi:hypothetical protein